MIFLFCPLNGQNQKIIADFLPFMYQKVTNYFWLSKRHPLATIDVMQLNIPVLKSQFWNLFWTLFYNPDHCVVELPNNFSSNLILFILFIFSGEPYYIIQQFMHNACEELFRQLKEWLLPKFATYGNQRNSFSYMYDPVTYDYIFHRR